MYKKTFVQKNRFGMVKFHSEKSSSLSICARFCYESDQTQDYVSSHLFPEEPYHSRSHLIALGKEHVQCAQPLVVIILIQSVVHCHKVKASRHLLSLYTFVRMFIVSKIFESEKTSKVKAISNKCAQKPTAMFQKWLKDIRK